MKTWAKKDLRFVETTSNHTRTPTLPGYGGAKVRAYTFAGSKNVIVSHSAAYNLKSLAGTVIGFDILTDSEKIFLKNVVV